MELYDYIYVDTDKIISVYSQLTGGVVELRESVLETAKSADNKRKYDFKVFKHDAGGTSQDKQGLKEIIKPYHSFLSELEQELNTHGHMIDLSLTKLKKKIKDSEFREQLKNTFCVKVTGRCVIEDYERIKSIADVFPEIVKLINKSNESSIRESAPYQELKEQIESEKSKLKAIKDRNQKSRAKSSLKAKEQEIERLVATSESVEQVDKWILDGMRTWIDAFLPGIVNLRIYPDKENMDTHIFGNLKKDYLFDPDPNSFHFTYGSMPTEDMTLVGIVTSVPEKSDSAFDPLSEFQGNKLSDEESVENAFRNVFRGFDGFEQMIRTCRYPRVLVYPLLVYRKASPNKANSADAKSRAAD